MMPEAGVTCTRGRVGKAKGMGSSVGFRSSSDMSLDIQPGRMEVADVSVGGD
jgi:hypothetical protein